MSLRVGFERTVKGEVRSHWVHEGSEGGPFRQWGGTGRASQDWGLQASPGPHGVVQGASWGNDLLHGGVHLAAVQRETSGAQPSS